MKEEKTKNATSTHDHTLFFDSLINLIPPRFYLPSADDGESEKPYFHGLTGAKKAAQKKKTKDNLKMARGIRLDPEKSSSTTVDLLDQGLKKSQSYNDDGGDDDGGGDGGGGDGGGDGGHDIGKCKVVEQVSTTYEELRERLKRRIGELRASRKWSGGKHRREEEEEEEREEAAEAAAKELRYGRVKVGEEKKKGGRRESKKVRLERLMEGKGEEGGWEVAGRRAAGEKVHDDPKLLKKSIRKENRRRERSRKEWAERTQETEMKRKKRHDRRKANLSMRIKEKRRHKIERREKKLMRPGKGPATS